MAENEQNKQGLQLELPQEVAQGEYANFAIITHSSSDFVVDFARVLPGVPKAQVRSRVILAPEHAKRLLAALQENIIYADSPDIDGEVYFEGFAREGEFSEVLITAAEDGFLYGEEA